MQNSFARAHTRPKGARNDRVSCIQARNNFSLSNFENSGTIQFNSSSSTRRGLCPKNFEKRAHPNTPITCYRLVKKSQI